MTTITSPPATSAPDRRSAQSLPPPPAERGADPAPESRGARPRRWWTRKDRNVRAGRRRQWQDVDTTEQDRIADTFRTALMLHVMR